MSEYEELAVRVAALEERLDQEAGLRASQDRDLSSIERTARAQQHLLQALALTQSEHNEKIDRLDDRLVRVEASVARVEEGLARVEGNVARVEGNVGRVEGNVARVEENVGRVEGNVARVEAKVDGLTGGVAQIIELLGRPGDAG